MVKINGREFDLDSIYIGDNEENPDEMKGKIQQLMEKVFVEGMLPKDALGMSDLMVEAIYAHAYRLYNAGKFDDAAQLFRFLIMLNPMALKFALGLGAALQMQKDFRQAAAAYAFAGSVDKTNPMPHYYASDCFIRLGDFDNAINVLKKAIAVAGDNANHSMIKERSLFILEGLEKDKLDAKQLIPKTVNQ